MKIYDITISWILPHCGIWQPDRSPATTFGLYLNLNRI